MVVQVGEEDFDMCNYDDNQLEARCYGNDVVQLDKPDKMWFICTKHNHCLKGMKLAIDMVDPTIVVPPPLPLITFLFPGTTLPPPLFDWPFPGTTSPPPPFGWPFPGTAPPPLLLV